MYFCNTIISSAKKDAVERQLATWRGQGKSDYKWKDVRGMLGMKLRNQTAVSILQTVVSSVRPELGSLVSWVTSMRQLQTLGEKHKIVLPNNLWCHYTVGQIADAEKRAGQLKLPQDDNGRAGFDLKPLETQVLQIEEGVLPPFHQLHVRQHTAGLLAGPQEAGPGVKREVGLGEDTPPPFLSLLAV